MVKQVTRLIHRFLELHILELQNNTISIASRYLMNYDMYIKVLNILNSYTKCIETYIDKASITDGENTPPFVIIGSTVELLDISSQEKRSLLITEAVDGSMENVMGASTQTVSFLSDIGRTLLLKEEGQSVEIQTTEGESAFRINRINYHLIL